MSTTETVTWVTSSAEKPPQQPDIYYAPNYKKWQARAARPIDTPYGFGSITQETFPLQTLHSELRRLSAELHSGHGFFVLRGLEPDKHTREENIIIYTGISAHVASHHSPNSGIIGSPAYTTDKQVFHTNSGDIVALFALETAVPDGASKLASTWRVYNEIARTRPDLIHTLSQSWDREIFEKAKDGKQWMERPLIYLLPANPKTFPPTPQRVSLQYGRRYFPISEAQAEALDTLHFTGEKSCVNNEFQKGDIQFVNNLAIFHARDGFVDSEEKQRHLLRLWLRDPENAWHTPNVLAPRWAQIYEGVKPENEVFLLEPFIRSAGNKGR
ncbi:hypothetical protein BDW69DRAFT_199622 [Aspergillus filifer]